MNNLKRKSFVVGAVLISLLVIGFFVVSSDIISGAGKPGSCLVFEKKYCDSGEVFKYQEYTMLGFNLPEGIPIFSPFDGQLNTSRAYFNDETYDSISVIKNPDLHAPNQSGFSILGAVESIIEPDLFDRAPVSIGEIVAVIGSVSTNLPNGYNIVISMETYDESVRFLTPDNELLREFFEYVTTE